MGFKVASSDVLLSSSVVLLVLTVLVFCVLVLAVKEPVAVMKLSELLLVVVVVVVVGDVPELLGLLWLVVEELVSLLVLLGELSLDDCDEDDGSFTGIVSYILSFSLCRRSTCNKSSISSQSSFSKLSSLEGNVLDTQLVLAVATSVPLPISVLDESVFVVSSSSVLPLDWPFISCPLPVAVFAEASSGVVGSSDISLRLHESKVILSDSDMSVDRGSASLAVVVGGANDSLPSFSLSEQLSY